jgi:glycosyltransferase involved in cell wall biosynthesis
MRILYLAHYYFPYMSSASLITHDIISRLQKRHDITLVVPYSPGVMISAAPSGVVIGRRPSHGKFPASPTKRLEFATLHYAGNLFPFEVSVFSEGLSLAVEAVNICKERTFDLILCQYHPANLASLGGLLAGKLLKIPCILRTEDLLLGSTLRLATRIHAYSALFFNRSAVNGCNVVLTQSSEFHELIRSYYGRKGATRISPNGVDTRMFSPEVSASSLREALELKNVKVILYVGSLSADYGLDRGIMALRAIVRKMQNVALVVVGDGP